ncbi:MAG: SDR family NAD(P)-dependent oxidoreductase [Pirellula sp.]|nr:SDR family NAD(P)-dependent oxidoreductase [Pirellula sp.]
MARVGLRVVCLESDSDRLITAREAYESHFGQNSGIDWSCAATAVEQVDLLWESVPESLTIKREALRPILQLCSEQTILASNSSYLAPSMIFRGFPNPERFAGFHFHVPPWFASAVDVMPAPRTSATVLERLTALVERMELTPIVLRREFPGYVFNNLLHPLLVRSMELVERGVCRPEDVERAWRAVTRMPVGPFGMMLEIGLPTMRQILDNAVQHLGDQSSIRAHRFMQSWSGQLDRDECEQIVAPDFSSAEANHRRPVSQRPSEQKKRFSSCQLVWEEADADLKPQLKLDELIRLHERAKADESESSNSVTYSERTIIFWPDCVPRNANGKGSCGEQNLSENLINLVHRMKEVFSFQVINNEGSQSDEESNLIAWHDSSSMLPSRWPGLSGLARSVWLEDEARRWNAGEANATKLQYRDRLCSMRYLEVDVQSARRGCLSKNSIDSGFDGKRDPGAVRDEKIEGDEKEVLASQLLHVHQRYERGQWRVQRLRKIAHAQEADKRKSKGIAELIRGTRWIVSGGGRGITFHLAKLLGEHGASLEMLGRTPPPRRAWYEKNEDEIQSTRKELLREGASHKRSLPAIAASFDSEVELSRNLKLLNDLKIEARYHQIDITNRDELEQFISSIEGQRGGIDGVLHGAGYEQTSLLVKKSEDSIRKTIESKVAGGVNLEAAIGAQTRWFIQLGSLAGYFGGIGQVDYSGANAMVGERALQLQSRWDDVQCLTIGWPGWEDVGMAARASSQWALQRAGHSLISIQEGVAHFRDLIEQRISGYVLVCNPDELPKAFLAKET